MRRYRCPLPFTVVRMRFLGEIASPRMGVSPLKTIQSFWNDEFPVFDREDEANAFFQSLMSLWNRMARHQDGVVVKLTKPRSPRDRAEAAAVMRLRAEEIDGFLMGLGETDDPVFTPALSGSVTGLRSTAALLEKIARKTEEGSTEGTLQDYSLMIDRTTQEVESLLTAILKAAKELRRQSILGLSGPLH